MVKTTCETIDRWKLVTIDYCDLAKYEILESETKKKKKKNS